MLTTGILLALEQLLILVGKTNSCFLGEDADEGAALFILGNIIIVHAWCCDFRQKVCNTALRATSAVFLQVSHFLFHLSRINIII